MPVVLVVRGNQRVDMRKAMPLLTVQRHAHNLLMSHRRCRLGLVPARCPAAAAAVDAVAAAQDIIRLRPFLLLCQRLFL